MQDYQKRGEPSPDGHLPVIQLSLGILRLLEERFFAIMITEIPLIQFCEIVGLFKGLVCRRYMVGLPYRKTFLVESLFEKPSGGGAFDH
ncbi:MAG: hypothetical protein IPJ82_11830 [Lewinellaceae bacterium]|nr:hypothetical protein [Lewinellaceae bacterium]